jgi:hypothetical protein
MTNVTYQATVASTIDALKSTALSENRLANAGANVRAFYGTAEAFLAVRKQFEADAIIPALETKHRASLAFEIKRGDKSEQAEIMRKAKTTARGFVASYFSKIKAHAFPTAKPEAEELSEEQKQANALLSYKQQAIAQAKRTQKLENADFNILEAVKAYDVYLRVLGITNIEADLEAE